MKQLLIALLVAMALPLAALAQDDTAPEEAAPKAAPSLRNTSFGGFSLDLPTGGTLETPGTAGWEEDEQVVFNWFGEEGDPVVLIQCRVDSFEDELHQEAYDIFCDTLLSNWVNDTDNYSVLLPTKPASDTEPRRLRNMIGGHNWNLIQIEDHSDPAGKKIYYSIFCTWNGPDIYTISFYYLNPITRQDTSVQDFGKPIIASFKVSGEGTATDEPEAEAAAPESGN